MGSGEPPGLRVRSIPSAPAVRGEADVLQASGMFLRFGILQDAPEQGVPYATAGGAWVAHIVSCGFESVGYTERGAMAFIRTWIPAA